MWEPDPEWQRRPAGMGATTVGVWLAQVEGQDWWVKRLGRPRPGDPSEWSDPAHYTYWRREVDVALDGSLTGPGLVAPRSGRVEEDEDGVTVWSAYVEPAELTGPFVARAMGRFAASGLDPQPWWCRNMLADRLTHAERRGGWPTLARTTVADLADLIWSRRHGFLDRFAALAQVPSHGDPAAANLLAAVDSDVLAVDWGTLGLAPVGADLGYYSLTTRESFDVLLDAYCDGGPTEDAAFGARVMAVFTAFSRAEWALARAADGEGALAGKYRHPAVAPYLLALQRQFPQVEALISWAQPHQKAVATIA